ncbi:MAG: terminase gpA endonuclease subunit [Pseudomonadota bacterium]|nr:terminase gpA endonuclease subunit [Pseudomonadota bacterium]
MFELSDVRIGQVQRLRQLPPMMTPEELFADALPLLDPPSRMSVTDAAERYMRVEVQGAWQNFDRSVTPYMVEPTDMTQSRLFRGVGFVGPSQSGKTKMLETVAAHAVAVNQRPTLIVHMTRSDRDKWVEDKLDPTIRNSPELHAALGKARDDSTFSRKRFKGMRLNIAYPTPTTLSGGTYALVLLTDLDHMPLVLGSRDNPEGTPVQMALQRIKTFLSQGCVLAEGSPALLVNDPSWRPTRAAPHELPPVDGGIVAVYNSGTRGRWYWECPDCGDEFEPRFDRLKYDESLLPVEAGERAEMMCPHCGTLIGHRHKQELNRAALAGRGGWRHESRIPGEVCPIDDANVRRAQMATYALNGAAASFSTWRDMVASFEEARRIADAVGDETQLGMVHFTEIGVPYQRRTGKDGDVGLTYLRDNAQDTPRGVAPSWTRFITVTVDVQKTYFPVQVTAWGEGGRAQVIDRRDLTTPPETAPDAERDSEGHARALNPAKYAEDWEVLKALETQSWPVEGRGYALRAAMLVVDFQGEPGVSDHAELFWRDRVGDGQRGRWFVSRGHGKFHHRSRVWYEAPERKSGGGAARRIKILNIATDRFKDTVAAMISRAEGSAAGALYLGQWMDDARMGEFIAEERTAKGWDKKKGEARNEGLDLTVMARAVAEFKGLLRLDETKRLPAWALNDETNSFAIKADGSAPIDDVAATPSGAEARPRKRVHRMSYLQR